MEEAREQEIGTDPQEDTGQNVIQENIPETPFDENVRILIMNAGYHGIYHTELHISCEEGFTVLYNGELTDYTPDSELVLHTKDFEVGQTVCICLLYTSDAADD